MEKEILTIVFDEDGNSVKANVPDGNIAVMAVADLVWNKLVQKDLSTMQLLSAAVAETLARDMDGNLQKQFTNYIKNAVPKFRERYKQMCRQFEEEKKNLS